MQMERLTLGEEEGVSPPLFCCPLGVGGQSGGLGRGAEMGRH